MEVDTVNWNAEEFSAPIIEAIIGLHCEPRPDLAFEDLKDAVTEAFAFGYPKSSAASNSDSNREMTAENRPSNKKASQLFPLLTAKITLAGGFWASKDHPNEEKLGQNHSLRVAPNQNSSGLRDFTTARRIYPPFLSSCGTTFPRPSALFQFHFNLLQIEVKLP